MSRTSRKTRAFRPSLSDDLETRVVPSAFGGYQVHEAAISPLRARRLAVFQHRQALVQQRLANHRATFATARTNLTPGMNLAYRSTMSRIPTTVSRFAGLTPGSYGYSSATTSRFAGLRPGLSAYAPGARTSTYSTLYGGAYGPTNATYAPNVSNATYAPHVSNATYATNLNNTTAALGTNQFAGNYYGSGLSNYTGPLSVSNPSVANSLYATPTSPSRLGGLGGLGYSYLTSGAYNYGSLGSSYLTSGAYGGPFSSTGLGASGLTTGAYGGPFSSTGLGASGLTTGGFGGFMY